MIVVANLCPSEVIAYKRAKAIRSSLVFLSKLDSKSPIQPVGQNQLPRGVATRQKQSFSTPIKQVFAFYFAVGFCSAGHVENCTETLSPIGICGCFSGTESIT
jgi:hypothetical protein